MPSILGPALPPPPRSPTLTTQAHPLVAPSPIPLNATAQREGVADHPLLTRVVGLAPPVDADAEGRAEGGTRAPGQSTPSVPGMAPVAKVQPW